jgi:Kef-type K+ transport system membrane component KefB
VTKDLVVVLGIAAAIPLLLGLFPRVTVPGELVEIVAGAVIGPSALAWVHPDEVIRALALFGLSFLLFLSGFEVDVRCFRGVAGRHVLLTVAGSAVLATGVGLASALIDVRGGLLVAISLLATWTSPVIETLANAGVLQRRVGVLAVACASAGTLAGVVAMSIGVAGSPTPLAGRVVLLGLLVVLLAVIGGMVMGAQHIRRVNVLVNYLADTSAQIRIRLTVLLVAGVAFVALQLGFEAVLGAFLAGVLVRTLDPEPQMSHPHYPIKLKAVGFGLLIPVFFITSGMTLDITGLGQDPRALIGVPLLIVALLIVRGLPTLSLRHELPFREIPAAALLQATSLPFPLTVAQVGVRMQLIGRAPASALILAAVVSVLVFPPLARRLLTRIPQTAHLDPRHNRLRRVLLRTARGLDADNVEEADEPHGARRAGD